MKTFSHVQNLKFPSPVPFVEKLPKFVLHQTKKFNRESCSKKGDVAGGSQSRVQLGFRARGWDLQREDGADQFSLLADLIRVAGELSSVEHLGGFDDSELHRKISKGKFLKNFISGADAPAVGQEEEKPRLGSGEH